MSSAAIIKGFGIFLIVTLNLSSLRASDGSSEEMANHSVENEEFMAGKFVIDHVKDSYEWHIITRKNGEHVKISLPVILYSPKSGLVTFMSDKLSHGSIYKGFMIPEEGEHANKIVEVNENGDITGIPLDFSITKNISGMILAAIILLILFIRMGRTYSGNNNVVPRGFNGFLEPMIIFIRDGIAIPNIGEHKYEKHMPYLLTVFFFILINNLMGLIPFFPFGANVTGNIAVTMLLALITFLITQFSGTKNYWKHVIAAPGVPLWLVPIMIPVEFIGLFTKPFALMIRLFANITAGHIIVLSLICLIFVFKNLWVSSIAIPMALFINILEILVAFLQAYVFTLLSALFIGLAAKEHHQ